LGLIAGAAVFVLAFAGLWALGQGIYGANSIVEKLAKVEYARGLITYILAVGTIAIAIVLVVGALLGSEEAKDNFSRGKEILTILIGVFGTILGFYYGSAKSEQQARLEISPFVIAQSADRTKTALFSKVTGEQAPYTYSIKFNNKAVHDINAKSENGQISVNIDTGD